VTAVMFRLWTKTIHLLLNLQYLIVQAIHPNYSMTEMPSQYTMWLSLCVKIYQGRWS